MQLDLPAAAEHRKRSKRSSLGEGRALLAFLATSKQLYACLIDKDSYPIWEIGGNVTVLQKQVESMLRGMGNFESNHVVPLAELRSGCLGRRLRKRFARRCSREAKRRSPVRSKSW